MDPIKLQFINLVLFIYIGCFCCARAAVTIPLEGFPRKVNWAIYIGFIGVLPVILVGYILKNITL